MQLHLRLGAAINQTHGGVERDLDKAVQRIFVHLVERHIHEAREVAFDKEALADQFAHQTADRAVLAERHQRTEVAIMPGLKRLPHELSPQLFRQMRRLLVCRLSARRHDGVAFRPRTGGAITDRKNIVVARGLQRLANDELMEGISFKTIKYLQQSPRPDSLCRHHLLSIDYAAIS